MKHTTTYTHTRKRENRIFNRSTLLFRTQSLTCLLTNDKLTYLLTYLRTLVISDSDAFLSTFSISRASPIFILFDNSDDTLVAAAWADGPPPRAASMNQH